MLAIKFLESFHDSQPPGLKVRSAHPPQRRGRSRDLRLRSKIQIANWGSHGLSFRCFIYHYPGYARFGIFFQGSILPALLQQGEIYVLAGFDSELGLEA